MLPECARVWSNCQDVTSSSFSRGGWYTVEPINMSTDLSDARNREALTTWIGNASPRLVIMNDCYPHVDSSSSHPQASKSQPERRERKNRERWNGACEFTSRKSCLDRFADELRRVRQDICRSYAAMCKHPRVHCVVNCRPTEPKCKWITTCLRVADEI